MGKFFRMITKEDKIFSERELKFTFAICRRPSVCRLSVCRL